MTDEQRHIVLHALGLSSKKKRAKGYRNYYMSNATRELEAMRSLGWLRRYEPGAAYPEDDWLYVVTKRGLKAAEIPITRLDKETADRVPE